MSNKSIASSTATQIVKFLEKTKNITSEEENESKSHFSETHLSPINSSQERRIVMIKKQCNFYQRVLKPSRGLSSNHIYKLFGLMGINQKSIQDPNFEQSYLYNHFQGRVVQKVEFFQYALLIDLSEPDVMIQQPSVEYLVSKYKAKGDVNFLEIGEAISQVNATYQQLQNVKPPEEKPESIKKWLDHLGQGMYVCFMGNRKFAISRQLLTYLEYDLEEFAVEAIKFRAIFLEIFSSKSYPVGVIHLLKCLKYMADLSLGKITLSDFNHLTTYSFNDFIESKNHVRSFCNMSFSFLNPAYLVHRVDYIYYKEGDKMLENGGSRVHKEVKMVTEREQERVRQSEYKTFNKITNIPGSLMKQNERKIAGFKSVVKEENNPLQN